MDILHTSVCLKPVTHERAHTHIHTQAHPCTGRARRDGRKSRPLQLGRWKGQQARELSRLVLSDWKATRSLPCGRSLKFRQRPRWGSVTCTTQVVQIHPALKATSTKRLPRWAGRGTFQGQGGEGPPYALGSTQVLPSPGPPPTTMNLSCEFREEFRRKRLKKRTEDILGAAGKRGEKTTAVSLPGTAGRSGG